jgi:hypothetical protein
MQAVPNLAASPALAYNRSRQALPRHPGHTIMIIRFDMGCEHPVEFVKATAGLSEADQNAILGENAARLFGL